MKFLSLLENKYFLTVAGVVAILIICGLTPAKNFCIRVGKGVLDGFKFLALKFTDVFKNAAKKFSKKSDGTMAYEESSGNILKILAEDSTKDIFSSKTN